ncbi:SdpI family protein [Amycolatopsis samaneae]|uniref:SdpI family protein n=1 Tax=Amycolatopsis samaneae TaxID=664691 RepID=A0ABW5GJW1_9PSEU
MIAAALVPILLGVVVGWAGFLGLRERLTRESSMGVRTRASMRSEEAFKLANRVAGLPILVGGAIGVLAGVAAIVMPTTAGLLAAAVAGVIGMFALVIGGGLLGTRAAATIPAPAPAAPAGCSGCACGAGGCGVLQRAEN